MKCFASILLPLMSALLALPHSAAGQKTYALGVAGGVSAPVGKLRDTQRSGYNETLALAIGVADVPLGVRFDGIYNRFYQRKNLNFPPTGAPAPSNIRISGLLGNLIYAFPGTTAKPYIIAGAGLYNIKADSAGAKLQHSLGFNAGLGVTFGIGPFVTFIESRYHSISRSVAKGGVAQFVPITLGLLF